jgi:hypothetical protein
MTQFSHVDFGGFSQWSPGMSMVGDMFNTQLKAKLDALCIDIAAHLDLTAAAGGARSARGGGQLSFDVSIGGLVAARIGQAGRGGCQNGCSAEGKCCVHRGRRQALSVRRARAEAERRRRSVVDSRKVRNPHQAILARERECPVAALGLGDTEDLMIAGVVHGDLAPVVDHQPAGLGGRPRIALGWRP